MGGRRGRAPAGRPAQAGEKTLHPIRTLLLLAVLSAAAWGGLRLLDGVRAEADWAARSIAVQEGTASAIAHLARRDSRAQGDSGRPIGLSGGISDMLARNSETLDFVLGYPNTTRTRRRRRSPSRWTPCRCCCSGTRAGATSPTAAARSQ